MSVIPSIYNTGTGLLGSCTTPGGGGSGGDGDVTYENGTGGSFGIFYKIVGGVSVQITDALFNIGIRALQITCNLIGYDDGALFELPHTQGEEGDVLSLTNVSPLTGYGETTWVPLVGDGDVVYDLNQTVLRYGPGLSVVNNVRFQRLTSSVSIGSDPAIQFSLPTSQGNIGEVLELVDITAGLGETQWRAPGNGNVSYSPDTLTYFDGTNIQDVSDLTLPGEMKSATLLLTAMNTMNSTLGPGGDPQTGAVYSLIGQSATAGFPVADIIARSSVNNLTYQPSSGIVKIPRITLTFTNTSQQNTYEPILLKNSSSNEIQTRIADFAYSPGRRTLRTQSAIFEQGVAGGTTTPIEAEVSMTRFDLSTVGGGNINSYFKFADPLVATPNTSNMHWYVNEVGNTPSIAGLFFSTEGTVPGDFGNIGAVVSMECTGSTTVTSFVRVKLGQTQIQGNSIAFSSQALGGNPFSRFTLPTNQPSSGDVLTVSAGQSGTGTTYETEWAPP